MFIHIWVCTRFNLFEQIKFSNRNFMKKSDIIFLLYGLKIFLWGIILHSS